MIELGKWYTYHGDTPYGDWDILPLSIHDNNVFSIVAMPRHPNVCIDFNKVSWFTDRIDDGHLTLSTDPPSFSTIALDDKQKATIFRAIFRSKE